MFVLILVPFVWGYLVASRVLREVERPLRWPLAYALGLLSFLTGVNALFHVTTLRRAVYITLLLLGAGALALLRLRRPLRRGGWSFGPVAGPVLLVLTSTAFFQALLWQMHWSDDDFFIHAPLMALYLRDVFPPRNPFFPDLLLHGHYGRDLTIAAFSTLVGERFLQVQYIVTALNHAASVLIIYSTARRYLRSSTQALWAVLFAFAGVSFDSRRGLLETFTNNNTFATLFLFVSIYLYLSALARRRWGVAITAGVAVGTFALLYETSFGVLAVSCLAFPFVLCGLRRRWRWHYFGVTAGILAIAGSLALAQGGALTDVARRHVLGTRQDTTRSEDERRVNQEIRVRFPKPGFGVTSYRGDDYPLWSPRLEQEAGTWVALLPLSALLMLYWRRPWGILVALVATVALLVPATVDFGPFNSESLRFLVLAGVAAAMLAGALAGQLWEATRGKGAPLRWAAALALASIVAVSFRPSLGTTFQVFRDAAKYPQDHYFRPGEWACGSSVPKHPCEPIDVSAAIALRSIATKAGRAVLDIGSGDNRVLPLAQATFSMLSGTFPVGLGYRVAPGGKYAMTPRYENAGFRSRAFWTSLDVGILDDLQIDYIVVNPENLTSDRYGQLRRDARLQRIVRIEEPSGAVREIYQIHPSPTPRPTVAPSTISVISVEPPEILETRTAYAIPIRFAGSHAARGETLHVSYDVLYPDGKLVNDGDEVRYPMLLGGADPRRLEGTLWLATPYEPGTYEVRLYGWYRGSRVPLRDGRGQPVVVPIRVRPGAYLS